MNISKIQRTYEWNWPKSLWESWVLGTVVADKAVLLLEAENLKVTRVEAEKSLKETQDLLRQVFYNVLVDDVNNAKKAGADVSDIEAQMPELLKKVTRNKSESY